MLGRGRRRGSKRVAIHEKLRLGPTANTELREDKNRSCFQGRSSGVFSANEELIWQFAISKWCVARFVWLLNRSIGEHIDNAHAVLGWIPQHATVRSRDRVTSAGRSPFEMFWEANSADVSRE